MKTISPPRIRRDTYTLINTAVRAFCLKKRISWFRGELWPQTQNSEYWSVSSQVNWNRPTTYFHCQMLYSVAALSWPFRHFKVDIISNWRPNEWLRWRLMNGQTSVCFGSLKKFSDECACVHRWNYYDYKRHKEGLDGYLTLDGDLSVPRKIPATSRTSDEKRPRCIARYLQITESLARVPRCSASDSLGVGAVDAFIN